MTPDNHSPFKLAIHEAAGDLPKTSAIVSIAELPDALISIVDEIIQYQYTAIALERLSGDSFEILVVVR